MELYDRQEDPHQLDNVAYRPTHIILDFIDERYDLLQAGDALITHSWDLQESGYLAQPWAAGARLST